MPQWAVQYRLDEAEQNPEVEEAEFRAQAHTRDGALRNPGQHLRDARRLAPGRKGGLSLTSA
jgi:hypothetical protein